MLRRRHGFILPSSSIARDILIPRYYDPGIAADIQALGAGFLHVTLRQLVDEGHLTHTHGDYVPKIHYGTGPYPYIRTSDLANWEIKASPKHGVPEAVFNEYSAAQDMRPGDILFVHEGTYLIGTAAMVTEFDGPLIYQHHLAKFRPLPSAPFGAFYLLAALESPLVRRQVRSKQFPADIIDSVVGRLEEVIIPYPCAEEGLASIEEDVAADIHGRARLRESIAHAADHVDRWLRGDSQDGLDEVLSWEPDAAQYRRPSFLGGRRGFSALVLPSHRIMKDVLLPRYYDDWVDHTATLYADRCTMETVGCMVDRDLVQISTGNEIGRLNYGTGDIPFIRTSDFGSWELKRDAKHGVADFVYGDWAASQDVQPGDILLVRDGSYLVGTSVLIHKADLPLLYCGGIIKLRSNDHKQLPPALLFALLNSPFARRQMRNKQFTRDVIDTLGHRILEVALPIPGDAGVRTAISAFFSQALETRVELRVRLQAIIASMFRSAPKAPTGGNGP